MKFPKNVPVPIWLFLIVMIMVCVPFILGQELLKGWKDASETARNFGLGIAGMLAATFGVYLAWKRVSAATRQAETSQESHFTDLFSKAIDQIGNETQSVRIGGIYALERIAKHSPKDHGPIMEVLTSFVRQELPRLTGDKLENQKKGPLKNVPCRRGDLSAALKVLGRRSIENDKDRLDFNMTNLDGALLDGMNFREAVFFRSFLHRARLRGSILTNARFNKADLSSASFQCANLRDASLQEANVRGSNFENAVLVGADFTGTDFGSDDTQRVKLKGADLTNAKGLTKEQLAQAECDERTTLPSNLMDGTAARGQ